MVAYSASAQVISCPPSLVFPRVEQQWPKQYRRENGLPLPINVHELCVRGEVIYSPPPSDLSELLQHVVAVLNPISNRNR
jgi:hypothetical protein